MSPKPVEADIVALSELHVRDRSVAPDYSAGGRPCGHPPQQTNSSLTEPATPLGAPSEPQRNAGRAARSPQMRCCKNPLPAPGASGTGRHADEAW